MELNKVLESYKTIDDFRNLSFDVITEVNSNKRKMLQPSNSFLGSTKNIKFWVFNLPRLITCPGRTPICTRDCYQIDPEQMLKGKDQDSKVLMTRKVNLIRSLGEDFVDDVVEEINSKKSIKEKMYIRIHASGDFYDETYLKKWIEIALSIKKNHPKYYFMAYTKSFEILDNVMSNKKDLDRIYIKVGLKPKKEYTLKDLNIHFLASEMDDTNSKDKSIMAKYKMVKYIVTANTNAKLEECADIVCAKCMKCYKNPKNDIGTILRK